MTAFTLRQGDIGASFSAAAQSYDRAAGLQRRVCAMLGECAQLELLDPQQILDLGCGTGASQQRLAAASPDADILGLDLAQGMLQQARQRNPGGRWVAANASALPLTGQCMDLVYANLCLQWCTDLETVFAECRRVLRPGGSLCFSTLGPQTLWELREAWACVDDAPHVNTFTTETVLRAALQNSGLSLNRFKRQLIQEWHPDAISLCRNLKAIGAHNLNPGRQAGMLGQRKFRRMTRAYERHRQQDGLLPASWEVFLIIAKPV